MLFEANCQKCKIKRKNGLRINYNDVVADYKHRHAEKSGYGHIEESRRIQEVRARMFGDAGEVAA